MAGISSIGVGSGLELDSLLTKLIEAERVPTATRLAIREARAQQDISAFGSLKSALSSLRGSVTGLQSATALAARSATVTDTTLVSATAGSDASNGSYSIEVLNLARAQKLVSAGFADAGATVGSGTLTIDSGGNSFDVEVSAGATLGDLRTAINSASGNTSVTATLLTVDDGLGGTVTKLVLSARATGVANAIGVTVADDDTTNDDASGLSRFFYAAGNPQSQLAEQQAALDARVSVDGFTAYSSTNTFTDTIDGVSFTALREPSNPPTPDATTLTVDLNRANVVTRVQDFVRAYNDAFSAIRDLTAYNATTGAAGPLLGDATARAVQSTLRRIFGDEVDSAGAFQTLSSIGVSVQRDGTLTLNTSKLNAALNSDFDAVTTLFTAEDGVATRLASTLDDFLGSRGAIRARTDGLDAQLREIDEQREALGTRIADIEQRYRRQFTALDQLVTRLQSSGDFLLAQLENTSKIIVGK